MDKPPPPSPLMVRLLLFRSVNLINIIFDFYIDFSFSSGKSHLIV